MKSIAKLLLVILAFVMASVAVSAAASMTVTHMSLGSSTQERSNPREDIERIVTGTITITNTGTENLSNLVFTVSENSKYAGKLKINNTTALPTSILPGATASVSFNVRVPENLDAVDADLNPTAFEVGQISFTASGSTATASSTSKVSLQAANNLKINKFVVKFDGSSDTVDNDDEVKNIKPGNDVDFVMDAKNTYSSRQDLNFEDVTFKIESSDDSAFDLDDTEYDLGTVDQGNTEQGTLSMSVEKDADKGTYSFDIFLEGVDDEYGSRHGEKWTIDLKVERESHDIQIEKLDISPASVCIGKETTVSVRVNNMGRNTEDDAVVTVEVDFMPISKVYTTSKEINTDLEEGDTNTQTFLIPVSEDVNPGKYRVIAKAYYDVDRQTDEEVGFVTVEQCEPPTPVGPVCGNNKCEAGETCSSCSQDCGTCSPAATCNDGIKNQGETGIDCGGPCPACSVTPPTGGVVQPPVNITEEVPLYVWALIGGSGLLFLVIIVMMVALVRRK